MDGEDDVVERALTFGPDRRLVGIWAGPTRSSSEDRSVVVMLNAGIVHRVGVSRIHVRLARVLAAHGYRSMRFDLSGIGDSERAPSGDGAGGLQAQVAADVGAALDYLGESYGANRFVLFGSCSGAHDALTIAARDDRVEAVVALDLLSDFLNWRHYAVHLMRRMSSGQSWWNALRGRSTLATQLKQRFRRTKVDGQSREENSRARVRRALPKETLQGILDGLLARDARLLLIFTGGLEHNYNHDTQFGEVFPQIAAHPNVCCEFLPRADHVWGSRREQLAAIDLTMRWVLESASSARR